MKRLEHVRILMYSHDTFGLGHLRRCRAIAHALVEQFKGLHILIISGSPIAGAFDFKARVDFVKIPSVIKLHNGEYTSIDQHIDIQETLQMRMSMINSTAQSFDPDIFIVDKEPLGLRGELEETLRLAKARHCTLVLGLRDVMDSPDLLRAEWERNDAVGKIADLYDEIWVYGPRDFWDPLTGMPNADVLRSRMSFTGFLDRSLPVAYSMHARYPKDYILVTAGGGGDGAGLIRSVLKAYRHDPSIPYDCLAVLGPFMPADDRNDILKRAGANGRITVIEFDNHLEQLIADARGIVGMCGYNTFCEVMSFDKRALIVPRMKPRREQYVRAVRASELGLIDILLPDEAADPGTMAAALQKMVARPLPSSLPRTVEMSGLDAIAALTENLIRHRERPRLSVIEGGL